MESEKRLELKIIALKDGFSRKNAADSIEYEDRIAELRIELTEQSQQVEELKQENENLQGIVASLQMTVDNLEKERETVVQEEAD